MRTEVKIGLLVCVVVVGLVAGYMMIFSGDEEPIAQTPADDFEPTTPTTPAALAAKPVIPPGNTAGLAGPLPTLAKANTAVRVAGPTMHDALPAAPKAIIDIDLSGAKLPKAEPVSMSRTKKVPTLSLRPLAPPKPTRAMKRTYVVKAGDKGFWGIARKAEVYGAGKYSYLIRRANPNVDSRRLRPGQTLVILPIPASVKMRSMSVAATTPRPGGGRTYVVREGDTCWTLAGKYLGSSSRFQQIVKANPGINASSLTVGQRIVIPGRTAAAAVARTTGRATVTAGPGQTTYTIAAGDRLSVISQRKYGNSSLWPAILKANPGMMENSLRVGRTIVLPSKSQAMRDAGSARVPTRTGGVGYTAGKPWYGD